MNDYFENQAGSGIAVYTGSRYQRGHGLSSFFASSVMPLLRKVMPYIGKQAIETGADFANTLKDTGDFKKAAKSTAKRRLHAMTNDALVKMNNMTQEGEGMKRRRKRSKKKRDFDPMVLVAAKRAKRAKKNKQPLGKNSKKKKASKAVKGKKRRSKKSSSSSSSHLF